MPQFVPLGMVVVVVDVDVVVVVDGVVVVVVVVVGVVVVVVVVGVVVVVVVVGGGLLCNGYWTKWAETELPGPDAMEGTATSTPTRATAKSNAE